MNTKADRHLFLRIDESDDELFYSAPRMGVHIDESAIAAIGDIFLSRIPKAGAILDLMGSWRSHLPPELAPVRVVGLGLSRVEMEDNPGLTEVVVHNLNREPRLPLPEASFDAAVLTVSVQYLIRPVDVFRDVGRTLRPGAPFIVSFSNRMFAAKAVAIWLSATEEQRVEHVRRYFVDSGVFGDIEAIDKSRRSGPPSDPIWAVVGYRIARDHR